MHELNKTRVRRAFELAADTYDRVAVLQRAVGERLIERLDLVKLRPAALLDAGSGTGACTRLLARRYRRARVVALDLARAMLARARATAGWFDRSAYVCGDAERLPLRADYFDLVVSNLTLQWCDPDAVFGEFLRVLRPGGLLMFTSFGPDTLKELRAAWDEGDPGAAHVHHFIDMHDLGDALVRAGFAEPVMDVERFTLTYSTVEGVLRDLKALGAHNALATQRRGLTGKARYRRFVEAYERRRADSVLPASYEIVYGHAWAPPQRAPAARPGEVRVPFGALRRR